jgi:O-antigen ligase
LLPASFTERMSTIQDHKADQSASTRVAVWQWTIEFAKSHPFGGGFDAFRQDIVSYDKVVTQTDGNSAAVRTEHVLEHGRAYHSSYFEMLGEQGYPGLAMWLLLHILGVVQMERIRRRYKTDPPEGMAWISPLADALQQAQIVYLVGGSFVGIAFQPFCYMLVGLQCGLAAYVGRLDEAALEARRLARMLRRPPAPIPEPAIAIRHPSAAGPLLGDGRQH